MKLTEIHIEELYKFTKKHYVEHYDVQTELVDHLANDIEQIWVENPSLSFEEARDKSFKKFGIFGFMDVIEAKQKQMSKKYTKILFKFIKEWFRLPKIIITATIFITFYTVIQSHISKGIVFTTLLFVASYEMYLVWKRRKKLKKEEKVFLLESMIKQTSAGFTTLTLINALNFINIADIEFNKLSLFWILFWALLLTLCIIVSYIINVILPEKSEELLEETYPEYKIS
ncbi:hypothetical protein [uncultured Polaribacter sp.]|uniref:hypothetical protein n=1 Tax=uncultured Polaribacter sp. TaxID=174711 RepID=UPI00259AFD6A|nr:hypothetical protein [uncultured Polaribacter sp.]